MTTVAIKENRVVIKPQISTSAVALSRVMEQALSSAVSQAEAALDATIDAAAGFAYPTLADAVSDIANLPAGAIVQIVSDEEHSNLRTIRERSGSGFTFLKLATPRGVVLSLSEDELRERTQHSTVIINSQMPYIGEPIEGSFSASDEIEGKFFITSDGSGYYNKTDWFYNPSLNKDLAAFDINKNFMFYIDGLDGGFQRRGHRPFNVWFITGQSNVTAVGATDGETPDDARVAAWNATLNNPGNAFVLGQKGVVPFVANNVGLEASKVVSSELDKVSVVVSVGRGGQRIKQWLPNPPSGDDLYAAGKNALDAMFAASGVEPFSVQVIQFIQGGGDENFVSLTLQKRSASEIASGADIYSWPGGFLELRDRWHSEPWASKAETKIILGEGSTRGGADRMSSGITVLAKSGLFPDLLSTHNKSLPTYDKLHFTGASIIRLGQMSARTYLSPHTWVVPNSIGQPSVLPLSEPMFGGDLFSALDWTTDLNFVDNGSITFDCQGSVTDLSSAGVYLLGTLNHPANRVIIDGGLLTSERVLPEADYTANREDDLEETRLLYGARIVLGTNRAMVAEGGGLTIKNFLIEATEETGQDALTFLNATLLYDNVTLFGTDGPNSTAIILRNSKLRPVNNNSKIAFAYNRGVENAQNDDGGAIGAYNSEVIIPGAVLAHSELDAVILNDNSWGDLQGVTAIAITQNDLKLKTGSRALVTDDGSGNPVLNVNTDNSSSVILT